MRWFVVALIVVLSSSAFVSGQEKKKLISPVLMPGPGVADPAGKVGFFPSKTGGIDALDLASGKVLWTSKEANRPLLASRDRLFAQKNLDKANQIRVVVLDASDGKRVLESEVIAHPYWVSVSVAYGLTYRSSARLDINALWLCWEGHAFYAGGAPPPPEVAKAARKDAEGQTIDDEQSREDCRHARQQIGRTARREQSAHSVAAAHQPAAILRGALHEDNADESDRDQNLNNQHNDLHRRPFLNP